MHHKSQPTNHEEWQPEGGGSEPRCTCDQPASLFLAHAVCYLPRTQWGEKVGGVKLCMEVAHTPCCHACQMPTISNGLSPQVQARMGRRGGWGKAALCCVSVWAGCLPACA